MTSNVSKSKEGQLSKCSQFQMCSRVQCQVSKLPMPSVVEVSSQWVQVFKCSRVQQRSNLKELKIVKSSIQVRNGPSVQNASCPSSAKGFKCLGSKDTNRASIISTSRLTLVCCCIRITETGPVQSIAAKRAWLLFVLLSA